MISGRAIIALSVIGVGLYVLKRGEAAASGMQGLGADPTQAELDAKLAAGEAQIAAINALPINLPPMPKVGPVLWKSA